MGKHLLAAVLLVVLTLPSWAAAQTAEGFDAFTAARHDLKLGFTVPGKVEKVSIKAGDRVKAGDILIALEDHEGEALMAIYERRASSDLAIQQAQKQLELDEVEYKAIKQAFDKGAGTPIEVDRARIRADLHALDVQIAKLQKDEAGNQLLQAKARHDSYVLRSPVDGVVDNVIIAAGETVEQLKPVLRLVVSDPMWIDVNVPLAQTMSRKVGDPVWVTHHLPGMELPVKGKIIHLATVADSGSETRLVRVEVPNAEGLPAGGRVTVRFVDPAGLAAAPAAPGAPGASGGEGAQP